MAYGMKISKPGKDVLTAGIKDLILDTSYPLLKVKASGSGTLSVSDGIRDSDTIAHNLGYAPHVLVFGQTYSVNGGTKDSNYRRLPYLEYVSTYYSDFGYTVDNTNLVIHGDFWDESTNSDTFSYFYYIFYDE